MENNLNFLKKYMEIGKNKCVIKIDNSYKLVNYMFLMEKALTKKERRDHEKLESILESLQILEKKFLKDSNNENAHEFSEKLKEYEKIGKMYTSESDKIYLDNRHFGIREYFLGNVNKDYLKVLWDEFN